MGIRTSHIANTAADLPTGTQLGGTMVSADKGDHILIHCAQTSCLTPLLQMCMGRDRLADVLVDKYNDSTNKTDQSVSINGEVVSTLSTCKWTAHGRCSGRRY